MSSKSSKEKLLSSLADIVKGVDANLAKVSRNSSHDRLIPLHHSLISNSHQMDSKLNIEKDSKGKLNEQYTTLVDKERLYYKATKEFLDECRKNEMLLSRLAE